jgi:hypothetical protein
LKVLDIGTWFHWVSTKNLEMEIGLYIVVVFYCGFLRTYWVRQTKDIYKKCIF